MGVKLIDSTIVSSTISDKNYRESWQEKAGLAFHETVRSFMPD
jgi:hypothetical protein